MFHATTIECWWAQANREGVQPVHRPGSRGSGSHCQRDLAKTLCIFILTNLHVFFHFSILYVLMPLLTILCLFLYLLRIFLTVPATVALSAERSFNKLKLTTVFLASTVSWLRISCDQQRPKELPRTSCELIKTGELWLSHQLQEQSTLMTLFVILLVKSTKSTFV